MLAIARRVQNSWGIGAITRAIQLCGNLQPQGGLLVLSATLFHDDRFIIEKLDIMKRALSTSGDELSHRALDSLPDMSDLQREPKRVNAWRDTLAHIANLDIRGEAIFGSQFEGSIGIIGKIPASFAFGEINRANNYVNRRISGVVELFENTLNRMTG